MKQEPKFAMGYNQQSQMQPNQAQNQQQMGTNQMSGNVSLTYSLKSNNIFSFQICAKYKQFFLEISIVKRLTINFDMSTIN